jgi:hypothetical protein
MHRSITVLFASALLSFGAHAAQPTAPVSSPLAQVECPGGSPAIVPLPAGYPAVKPPAKPLDAFSNGLYNWNAGYDLQSLVYHLMVTHDPRWAGDVVASAEHLLAQRNANSPLDGQPYAWSMPAEGGYVWVGFVGHLFAPMMQFARTVVADPKLGACTVQGRTLRSYAGAWLADFDRAMAVHASELASKGDLRFYRFTHPVPAADKRLQDTPLPVNMNADMFMAALHSIPVEAALGKPQVAQSRRELVTGFVRYLTGSVLQQVHCAPARTCLRWNYSTRLTRAEDLGHSNVVAKFLLDASQDGYGVKEASLTELANTIDNLFDDDGKPTGDLLDGSRIAGVATSVYDLILLGRFSPSLRAKMDKIVVRSHIFAYAGPWLEAQR